MKGERVAQLELILRSHPEGLRKSDIARRIGVHRSTIGRYIDALGYMMHYDPDMNAGKLQEMSNYMQVQHSLAYRKRTGLSKAKELFLDLVNTRHYKLAYCVYRQYTRLKSIVNK